MAVLQCEQGVFPLNDSRMLTIPALTIQSGESWAFVGSNGSGKSSLARALAGDLPIRKGFFSTEFICPARISFEQLQNIISEEWERNNTDMLSANEHDTGRTTAEIIQDEVKDPQRCQLLAAQFGISPLLERYFKYLSTGETRKALLCRVLMPRPDLLILDDPFDGLDVASRENLSGRLNDLSQQGYTLVLILNRFDEIPAFINHAGVLADCTLTVTGSRSRVMTDMLVAQLAHSERLAGIALPEADESTRAPHLPAGQSRIILKNGVVTYDDRPVLHGLNWEVKAGQHWHIIGPNGAGKSTLLSLVTGDHPQGYSNDLTLFGRRRGSGETIWDIKRHIGYVSSSLHMDYRVSATPRTVIISGFFDSIGLYQVASDRQKFLANQWLERLGMTNCADQPFQSLSWGQQRLILIVRALVKYPALLILDEPLQGLDPINRQLVRRFIDVLISQGETQLLFISHHAEDAPQCITHRLTFIPDGAIYRYQQETLPTVDL